MGMTIDKETGHPVGKGTIDCTMPRVWVGGWTSCPIRWEPRLRGGWACLDTNSIVPGDVFIPYVEGEPEPTVVLRDLDTLATCKVVDW